MKEREFGELRRYREAEGSCISDWDFAKPSPVLRRKGWVREIVKDCWAITPAGVAAFDAVVNGTSDLTADPDRVTE